MIQHFLRIMYFCVLTLFLTFMPLRRALAFALKMSAFLSIFCKATGIIKVNRDLTLILERKLTYPHTHIVVMI